ncbi:TPA: LD-carboxypeptidase [Candidatus Woesearchaeota archaeon]|nr:LD-carboxypeptidase [Candidatus Woesearchaeota archaeon]
MIPTKLKIGDEIRVIAPARSLSIISNDIQAIAIRKIQEMGFKVTFSENVREKDDFNSSLIQSRVEDLHRAFKDKKVRGILTAIGGYNSNQLLSYLDYDLIQKNPKILCGFSDITCLTNAIFAQTNLVTYSGPHLSSFGMIKGFEYTLDYFKKCLLENNHFEFLSSKEWSDDPWFTDQNNRNFIKNEGFWLINEGKAKGKILGGNQCTFNLLQGTQFMPHLENTILFLEDDEEAHPETIDRDLQSIIHQRGFDKVRGIVFGRCQKATKMTRELLTAIIRTKKELNKIPIIANVDFGHTTPTITFPIGGTARLEVNKSKVKLEILQH